MSPSTWKPDSPLAAIEHELAGMEPRPLSATLHVAICRELQEVAPKAVDRFSQWRRRVGACCAAALAVAWLAMVLHRPGPDEPPQQVTNVHSHALLPPQRPEVLPPTLWEYRLAYADSPQRFAGLLDEHAAMLLPTTPPVSLDR